MPLTWGGKAGENVRWKAPLPKSDNPFSSPIIASGRIFLTYSINKGPEHHVVCFNQEDGRQLWDVPVAAGPWKLTDLRGGYGAPTPAADAEHVYAVFGSAVIACLDRDGKEVWRKELARHSFDVAMGSSPILYKNTVLLLCDQNAKKSSLVAFDAKTGDVAWEALRPEVAFAHTTPVLVDIGGTPQLLIGASNALQGVNPADGKVIWSCAAPGDSSSPVYAGTLVYSDGGRGGAGVAVDPTGSGDVTKTHLKWKTKPGLLNEGLSSPALVADQVYRLHNGGLTCMKLATGEIVFNEKLPGISAWPSPIVTPNGNIYFASAGKSVVLKPGPKLEILATNDLGDPSPAASAAVADGKLYLRGGKFLWCIGGK